jgi:hypothetical protein
MQISEAQNSEDSTGKSQARRSSIRDRITFNIGGGLWLGSTTNISVLPQIGYKITDRLTAGVGLNFQYYKSTINQIDPIMIYGGSLFTRYHLTSNLFAQAEYQLLQYNDFLGDYGLIGGGYTSNDGFYFSGYYIFRYPANNNAYGVPYVIRFGYMF